MGSLSVGEAADHRNKRRRHAIMASFPNPARYRTQTLNNKPEMPSLRAQRGSPVSEFAVQCPNRSHEWPHFARHDGGSSLRAQRGSPGARTRSHRWPHFARHGGGLSLRAQRGSPGARTRSHRWPRFARHNGRCFVMVGWIKTICSWKAQRGDPSRPDCRAALAATACLSSQ